MRRLVLVLPLALAGCATGRQAVAVKVVEQRAPGTQVSCTRSAHVGYIREVPTKTFLCTAKRGANDCDHWRVTFSGRRSSARREERHGECLLPAS